MFTSQKSMSKRRDVSEYHRRPTIRLTAKLLASGVLAVLAMLLTMLSMFAAHDALKSPRDGGYVAGFLDNFVASLFGFDLRMAVAPLLVLTLSATLLGGVMWLLSCRYRLVRLWPTWVAAGALAPVFFAWLVAGEDDEKTLLAHALAGAGGALAFKLSMLIMQKLAKPPTSKI